MNTFSNNLSCNELILSIHTSCTVLFLAKWIIFPTQIFNFREGSILLCILQLVRFGEYECWTDTHLNLSHHEHVISLTKEMLATR